MGLIRYSCGHISGHHEPIHVKFGVWGFFIMFYWNMVMKMLKCKKENLTTSHFSRPTLCLGLLPPKSVAHNTRSRTYNWEKCDICLNLCDSISVLSNLLLTLGQNKEFADAYYLKPGFIHLFQSIICNLDRFCLTHYVHKYKHETVDYCCISHIPT